MQGESNAAHVPVVKTPPPRVVQARHVDRLGREGVLLTATWRGVVRYAFFPHAEKPSDPLAVSLGNVITKRHAEGYDPLAGLDKEAP